ncbi:hypothetical protein EHS25_008739 [Saitozyma podzolica]|uniref:Carboxylesterase type B domain-containing protein n=1 Tax=Saitozyma podzolica TaxID=1890683 RepID=A0A427YMJ4_9TREE|nr:hypothetical protein EHS25_008739 [Saitozyma podzolica]
MMLPLLALLPLALASPLFPRQNATSSNSTSPGSPSGSGSPSVTIIPEGRDVYTGIPFAAPPVGDLRFTAPQAPTWNTTSFSATKPPPACLQNPNGTLAGSYGISEDCLYLNVYTPAGANASTAYLPVMVWVYGGGFTSGSSSYYNATFLMLEGISTGRPFIFVSLNYRLGIFGWGSGAEIAQNNAANLGLRDVTKGLQWVQENIWAFGGNPSEASGVTVFGQSAGAISISLLYLQPNLNLFSRAIMESGAQSVSPIGPTATTWQTAYNAVVSAANCSVTNTTAAGNQSTFDCLKALPAQQLLAAQLKVQGMLQFAGFIFGKSPSIDGDLIPDSPHTLLANGQFAQKPYISGNVKDEGTTFVPTAVSSEAQLGLFVNVLEPIAPDNATLAQLLQLYPNDPTVGSPFGTGNETFGLSPVFKQAAAIVGDGTFQSSRRWFLQSTASNFPDLATWSYFWNVSGPGTPAYEGVPHASEVLYVFGAPQAPGYGNYTASDKVLSSAIGNYWINFAVYGDPSPANSPVNLTSWPQYGYSSGSKNLLDFSTGNISVITDDYREQQIAFFSSNPTQFNLRRGDSS